VAGCSEHGNTGTGPIKGREFLEQVTDYQRLKDTVAWS
jgi:hypothetical protein